MFIAAIIGLITANLINWARDFVMCAILGIPRPRADIRCFASWRQAFDWVRHRDARAISKSFWLDAFSQIALALLFAYLWQRYGVSFGFFLSALFCSFFALIALIDLRYRIIPNVLLFPAALVLLIGGASILHIDLILTLAGGLLGVFLFALVAWLTPDGLGGGDVKLAGLIGLLFGFPYALWALVLGVLLGGVGAMGMLAARRGDRGTQIPYAPFLCLGAMIALLYNPFLTFH